LPSPSHNHPLVRCFCCYTMCTDGCEQLNKAKLRGALDPLLVRVTAVEHAITSVKSETRQASAAHRATGRTAHVGGKSEDDGDGDGDGDGDVVHMLSTVATLQDRVSRLELADTGADPVGALSDAAGRIASRLQTLETEARVHKANVR